MLHIKLLFLMIFCIAFHHHTSAKTNRDLNYKPKYHTTAHHLLQLEEDYSDLELKDKNLFYNNMYLILDNLLDSAKLRVDHIVPTEKTIDENDVKLIFLTIDSVLAEQHFIVCILVDKLSDALTPRKLDQFNCYKLLNNYRQTISKKNPDAMFYGVDCDLGAILYISIGEILNYPIHLVEVPNHNFVRWRFSDQRYINFDNNSGNFYKDEIFRLGQSLTAHTGFTIQEQKNCHFLEDMTPDQIKGYYLSIVAIFISHQKRYAEAEKLYKESIIFRPYDVLSLNNLSWMYLTVPIYNSKFYYNKAYSLSEKVDRLLPSSVEYKDTYSCACAGIGNFNKAIEIEKLARNKPYRISGYKKGMTCLELKEKIW